ncbi:MAG: hypothetical protein F6K23_20425 [Okeania sp. SIO2C9]|uniref:hypothetical protein n=1 Tax=Okeania sp. SIO2C9 TaxID=2607791 RepID=UPI0013C20FF1|nr:hypothetical protein [Okeania sp. SIO2C9]NEQ75200.1 hypothetical protein [Okeania sp. SIO2C9]
MTDRLQPQELQQINLAIQVANVMSHSLLLSLGREYLGQSFKKSEYINYFPPTVGAVGNPYFLHLKSIDDSKVNSLEEQLTALQLSFSACHNLGGDNLVFMINSDGSNNHVYLGTRSRNTDFVDNLQAMLKGNLPGTELELYLPNDSQFKTQIEEPLKQFNYPTAITGIPSVNLGYSQIDRLLRSLEGSPFSYMVIAEPMVETEVNQIIYNLRELLGQVSSLSKVTLDENFTKTISEELQRTVTNSRSISSSTGGGKSSDIAQYMGTLIKFASLGLEIAYPQHLLAVKIGAIAAEHIIPDIAKKWSETLPQSSTAETASTSDSQTTGLSKTTGQTLKREYINAHAQGAEIHIKEYIKRFEQARSLGSWNVGVYFLGEDEKIAQRGANCLKGMFSGEKSTLEPLRVHKLYEYHKDSSNGTLYDLRDFQQPSWELIDPQNPQQPLDHPLGSAFNRLTTPLNTKELSALTNIGYS